MVMGKKVLIKSHKYATTVSFYVSTVWRIESNNLSLSRLTLDFTLNLYIYVIIKSSILKKNVVIRGSFSKVIFILKVLRNSITHH